MAQLRDPKVSPLIRFEDKLRSPSALRWRETRITADGLELEAIDTQTGQVALVTVSPVNAGICPVCGHVDHLNAVRCEAVRAFTKDPCDCRPIYGRFPVENRERDEPALPASMRSEPIRQADAKATA